MSNTTVSNKIKIRLHYLDSRGRAQAPRYMLEDIAYAHKNVDYQEDFEKVETFLSTWPEIKSDQTISGPFRTLPVLHWNDTHTFGQTLTIAHVLAKKFDLYGKVTSSNDDQILLEGYLNGVTNCAYTDVISNALLCLWTAPDIEDKQSPAYNTIKKLQNGLETLNLLLQTSSTSFFYNQVEPTVADYFVFEAYSIVRDIHPKLLPNNCDALVKHQQIMKERPALANYFKKGKLFKRFTAAPHEEGYLSKLAQIK